MQRIPNLMVCLSVFAGAAAPQAALIHSHRDPKVGLIIHYPAGWTIEPDQSNFTILSFDPRKRPPQLLVPLGGAQIIVAGAPPGVSSVADWLRSERVGAVNGDRISTRSVPTARFGMVIATVVEAHPTVFPEGTLLEYIFELENRPLKVTLLYRGQKRAEYFEGVFSDVLKNLEPKKP